MRSPPAKRVFLIVLDSVGIGELPDAALFGDEGSNTLANTAEAVRGLSLPHLEALGLGNIHPLRGVPPAGEPKGFFGKMREASPGKDTTTGHWEMMGIILDHPFATFPNGFPEGLVSEFMEKAGVKGVLGNKAASGTEIIKELGEEHMRTGLPIIYTSADSVFQIACHEEVVPVKRLYEMCLTAFSLIPGYRISRVIARPFVGKSGSFKRTERRKDFTLEPPGETVLDLLLHAGVPSISVGKVKNIFGGKGFSRSVEASSNEETMARGMELLNKVEKGFLFANLVDFDMLYGHRNDPLSYAAALARFDERLPEILSLIGDDDLLIITADHGCDPTTPSTDHSREYVPLLVFNPSVQKGKGLGVRESFADLGLTILEAFGVRGSLPGKSFLKEILS